MDRTIQIVFEVDQFKLSREAWLGDISRHIIFYAVGMYKNHPVQSAEHSLKRGTQVALPWSSKLSKVIFHYFYIDDKVKVELGESEFLIPNDNSFKSDGSENRMLLPIYPRGGNPMGRIGKVLTSVFIQELYDDGKVASTIPRRKGDIQGKDQHYTTLLERPPDNFRFRRLNKAVNWQRLRTTDIDRVIESNNIRSVLSCIDDVAYGDVTEEDCDPRIQQVLQIAQFSVQYLLGTKKVLNEKKAMINDAIEAFEDEEKILDLKLSKLRARTRAYRREMDEMDRIADSYKHTLRSLGYRHNRKTSTWEPIYRNSYYSDRARDNAINVSTWNDGKNDSGDDDRPIVNKGWKQARKQEAENPAFPSMTRKISVSSARSRASHKSSSDEDHLSDFHPSTKSKKIDASGQLKQTKTKVNAHQPHDNEEDSDRSIGVLVQNEKFALKQKSISPPTKDTVKQRSVSSDSDSDHLPSFELPQKDFTRPEMDDSFDRTSEITQKSKQAARGFTVIEVPSVGDGRAREIKPIQVRAGPVTSKTSSPTGDIDQISKPSPDLPVKVNNQDDLIAPAKKVERETPPKGKSSPIVNGSKQTSPQSDIISTNKEDIYGSTKKSLASSFGAPSSTGAISVDSLMVGTRSRSESKDEYKSESRLHSPNSPHESPKEAKGYSTSSMGKHSLANTYPVMRSSTPDAKGEQDSLMKSSSGIYHVSNSSMDMESFEDHSSYADLPPLQTKQLLVAKVPSANAAQPRTSKNDLYLEDSEDFREEMYPASPSPFKRMEDETKDNFHSRTHSRDGRNTPGSFRGSGRNTPQSVRSMDERYHDPYEDDGHARLISHERAHQSDEDEDEYSQSFASPAPSPMRVIDTSRSTVLELNFDTQKSNNNDSNSNNEYKSGPNSFSSGAPTRDYPSSRSSPNMMHYGNAMDSFTRRASNGDDDAVLMGTAKLTQTGGYTFSDASTSNKSRLSGTENIERDSLGGTFNNTELHRTENSQEGILSPYLDESMEPRDSLKAPVSKEESSFDVYLGRRTPSVPELSRLDSNNSQTMTSDDHDRFSGKLMDSTHPPPGQLRWETGRAPLDLIELAEAFEVHVSGIKVYPGIFPTGMQVYLEIEFLDTKSPSSHVVRLDNNDLPVSVSFSTYMSFTEGNVSILKEEIEELQDKMSIQINVVDADTKEPIGQAIVEPWIMIENGVNILRKDVELFDYDMRSRIGDMVVDVKGYLLFCKYGR